MKTMLKQNKWMILFSSIVIILPVLFGLVVWDTLPEQMAIHWSVDGNPDAFAGTAFGVLFLPLFLLALHWICILTTAADNKHREQSRKVFVMVLWIMPALSLYLNALIYATAFGLDVNISWVISILLAVGLMFVGNYLPKCKQNRTVGIKITWTLASEDNWNATHRFAGKVWFICGLVSLLGVFLPMSLIGVFLFVLLLVVAVVPMVYSYQYYKKQLAAGEISPEAQATKSKDGKIAIIVTVVLLLIMIPSFTVLMFTGDVTATCQQDALTVDSTYYDPITVKYEDVESIEFRETDTPGQRAMGFGSATLLLGTFNNEEFGNYTRYSYTKTNACIVMKVDGKVLVVGLESYEQTKALYDELEKHVGGN